MRAAATNYVSGVIGCLLENGADGTLRSLEGKTAFDYVKENPYLKETEEFWMLSDARYAE
jgi:hypothetical protein